MASRLLNVYMCTSYCAKLQYNLCYLLQKNFPLRSVFLPVSTVPDWSVPFTSVLTVYRGQTVLALGVNSSAKFTACVGEA